MRRAVLFPGVLVLVFSLACGAAGCNVFLGDWGEIGQPCNKRSHCKHEQYCVGLRCTPKENTVSCELDSYCQRVEVLGPESWCNDDNVCDHPPIEQDSNACQDGGQTLCN